MIAAMILAAQQLPTCGRDEEAKGRQVTGAPLIGLWIAQCAFGVLLALGISRGTLSEAGVCRGESTAEGQL